MPRTTPTTEPSGWPHCACSRPLPAWPCERRRESRTMRTLVVTGGPLTVADVVDVAHGQARAELAADVAERMERSRAVVAAAVDRQDVVYGVTTGFGALADTVVTGPDLLQMQHALVRSHAA